MAIIKGITNYCWFLNVHIAGLTSGVYRSTHWRSSLRKDVLRNFAKFTGKHLCKSLFYNKVAGLRTDAWNFIKQETKTQVFPCEFCEISHSSHVNLIFVRWEFILA